MEFGLLVAVILAVGGIRLVVALEGRGSDHPEAFAAAWEALIVAGLAGLAVGRIVAMIAAGVNPLARPLDILIVRGGVDTVAASAGALATFATVARRALPTTADIAAPAVLAGLAGWHAGCFTRGACLGTTTDLPWAVAGPTGVGRHPVEVYAALLLAIGCVVLFLLRRRLATPGVIAGGGLAVASLARLVTQPMRLGIGGGPAVWYGTGVALGAVVVLAAWRRSPGARAPG